jgi:hypothetical protein
VLNNTPGDLGYGFTVDQVEFGRVDAAFITTAEEGFEKPVVQWIISFFAGLDNRLRTVGKPRNLLR